MENVLKDAVIHPSAAIFPELPPAELKQLADSIFESGLQQKIKVWDHAGIRYIVDGRNRIRALLDLQFGIKAENIEVITCRPDQVAALVIAENIHRRHLTATERADLVIRARTLEGEFLVRLHKPATIEPPAEAIAPEPAGDSCSKMNMSHRVYQKGVSGGVAHPDSVRTMAKEAGVSVGTMQKRVTAARKESAPAKAAPKAAPAKMPEFLKDKVIAEPYKREESLVDAVIRLAKTPKPKNAGDILRALGLVSDSNGGHVSHFLRRVSFLPWLKIMKSGTEYTFTVNPELRDICEGVAQHKIITAADLVGLKDRLGILRERQKWERSKMIVAPGHQYGVDELKNTIQFVDEELDRLISINRDDRKIAATTAGDIPAEKETIQ